jgi:phosphoribosylaminoimidazole (AIR) synthetase
MNSQKNDKYKMDGVNIDLGDEFSKFAGALARDTYNNSPFVKMYDLSRGNFRGPRGYQLYGLPKGYLETGAMDGVGTKVVIIDAAYLHEHGASNLIAMTAMDITRYGGLPLIFLNILDVNTLGKNINSESFKACKKLMLGLRNECNKHHYVILTGETAELGWCVGSENPDATVKFNWGGAMLGVYHPDKMILGDTLRLGQVIMVLKDAFRSNGISSARKALEIKYGFKWWHNKQASSNIVAAAAPAVQYDRFLNFLHGWNNPNFYPLIDMHLIVHLSGGAFESKLGKDMLEPLGLSAVLKNLFSPPPIMRKCARWRGMTDDECYRTWNGGQGAMVVIDKNNVERFCQWANVYGIEAKAAGVITEKAGYNVAIHSKFSKGVVINY